MNLRLTRDVFGPSFTLGILEVDTGTGWRSFGYTCEDLDRGLTSDMTTTEIAAIKIKRETAIPTGTYKLLDTWSPKYQRNVFLVADVPGFQGIRIHAGNDAGDTEGCILPGLERGSSTVSKSSLAVKWLEEHGRALGLRTIEIRRANE